MTARDPRLHSRMSKRQTVLCATCNREAAEVTYINDADGMVTLVVSCHAATATLCIPLSRAHDLHRRVVLDGEPDNEWLATAFGASQRMRTQ